MIKTPKHLTEIAVDEWKRLVKVLGEPRFEGKDYSLIMEYCEAVAASRQITKKWHAEGCPVVSPNTNGNMGQHPMLSARNDAAKLVASIATKLGFCRTASKTDDKPVKTSLRDSL